ncbi:hypothetical protein [Pseudomonas sp. F(2018)]|uniref:hypothetical protein n=1 Tax=Pseudomonas sp. F(2018) TaxID=2502240 RepID=UPI0010F7AA46|nr:hypothetical protein [Pseudomonas sp. F(2018)]
MDKEIQLALLAALISTTLGAAGFFWREWRQRKATRHALLAEVASLVEIEGIRGYLAELRDSAAKMKRGDIEKYSLRISIIPTYRCIYDAHLNQLGCLKPSEAGRIVRFYQLADSFVRDVTEGGALYRGTSRADVPAEAAEVLQAAIDIGKAFDAKASAKWWQLWR